MDLYFGGMGRNIILRVLFIRLLIFSLSVIHIFNSFREGDNARIYIRLLSYVVWALGALYICVLLCLCMNIRISIAVLKTSAIFLSLNMHSMLVPLLSFVLSVGYICLWLYIAIYVFSMGEITAANSTIF